MIEDKKVLIYMKESAAAPKGGPAAVGYYYLKERDKRKDKWLYFISCPNNLNNSKFVVPNFYKKVHSWLKWILRDIIIIRGFIQLLYGKSKKALVDLEKYDVVHFHSTRNLFQVRESLDNYKGKIILMSHPPIPYAQELIEKLPLRYRWLFPNLKKKLAYMDYYAFMKADYIIFPCPQAEEPYYNNWEQYKEIHKRKESCYRYLLTGIPQTMAKRCRKEVLAELNIPMNDFVISYVGRHNIIKGYDLLKIIGKRFLTMHHDAWILVAGNETPIKRLEHERWKEIGWTNEVHSFIAASDVFVLPNKETYFDIVMLEILSLGKIVVASRTGGNKYFEGQKGIFLYDTLEEAISILENIKNMSYDERISLGGENIQLYNDMFTVSKMYDCYKILIEEIANS